LEKWSFAFIRTGNICYRARTIATATRAFVSEHWQWNGLSQHDGWITHRYFYPCFHTNYYLLGETGINHGIELHESVVNHAKDRVQEFVAASCLFGIAVPEFVVGNALLLDPSAMGSYDRVYCGANVQPKHHRFICSLTRIGGICVLPHKEQVLEISKFLGNGKVERKSV
jgi:hypothetical protein